MPRTNKITRAAFAPLLRAAGPRAHGRYFSLLTATLTPAEISKSACVVSKKVSNRAVDRVRIKRHVREAMRAILADERGTAYVLYAKKEALRASPEELRTDIKALFERAAARGTIRRT